MIKLLGASSLLTEDITTMISGFGADIIPTVMSLLTILVPIGLSLWAIGFGVKKGLDFLKKNANKSV